jgi:hypothetical protein
VIVPATLIDPRTVPVRISQMKRMSQSPQHYLAAVRDQLDTPTMAMRLGTLGHATLWPDVAPPFVIYEGERRGNAWKEFKAAHTDVEIYTTAEVARASHMAEAIDAHPDASALLRAGMPEHHLRWRYIDRHASSRLDVYDPRAARVVELKTCRSSHPEWFIRDALRMGYVAQVAFYRMAVAHVTGCAASDVEVLMVAVESARPHVVTVFEMPEETLVEGEKLCRAWIERILVCEAANHWPGYVDHRVPFLVPNTDDVPLIFGDEDNGQEHESEAA